MSNIVFKELNNITPMSYVKKIKFTYQDKHPVRRSPDRKAKNASILSSAKKNEKNSSNLVPLMIKFPAASSSESTPAPAAAPKKELFSKLENFFRNIDDDANEIFEDVSSLSSVSDKDDSAAISNNDSPGIKEVRKSRSAKASPASAEWKVVRKRSREQGSSRERNLKLIKKTKKTKSNEHVHNPTNLINPFKVMAKGLRSLHVNSPSSSLNPVTSEDGFRQVWKEEVSNDINEIRVGSGKAPDKNKSPVKGKLKESPDKRTTRVILNSSPLKRVTSASPASRFELFEDVNTSMNDDHCSTCLQIGKLMCCDSCPRAFHPECLEEGYTFNTIPEGKWDCKQCVKMKTGIKLVKPANPDDPPAKKVKRALKQMVFDLNGRNPRVFELPPELRESVPFAWTHPVTGAYIDLREFQVTVHPSKIKNSRQHKTSHPVISHSSSTASLPEPPVTQLNKEIPMCFKCFKSEHKLRHANLLNSFSLRSGSFKNNGGFPSMSIQADRSPLIKCDYCNLYWHLDCLDPPLSNKPMIGEAQIVDMNFVRNLRKSSWGVDGLTSNDAKIKDGYVEIKKKWMCPCHADWLIPVVKKAKEKEQQESVEQKTLQTSPRKRRGKSPEPPTKRIYDPDCIKIVNDPETKEKVPEKVTVPIESTVVLNGVEHMIPESNVKLDFFSRVNGIKELAQVLENERKNKMENVPSDQVLAKQFPPGLGAKFNFDSLLELFREADKANTSVGPSTTTSEIEALSCQEGERKLLQKALQEHSLHCTEQEAVEWLVSLTKLQEDVKNHLFIVKN